MFSQGILTLSFLMLSRNEKKKRLFWHQYKHKRQGSLMIQEYPETSSFPANVHIPKSDFQNVRKIKLLLSYLNTITILFTFSLFIVHCSMSSLPPLTLPSAYSCCQIPLLPLPSPSWRAVWKNPEHNWLTTWYCLLQPNMAPPHLTRHRILRGFPGTV